jgi:hypothetical protein
LVPLAASSAQVAAYLRRAGDRAVLVVANLGPAAASGVVISSEASVLPPGEYAPRNLLGGPEGAALSVSQDGSLQGYVPFAGPLPPREALVLDLVRR